MSQASTANSTRMVDVIGLSVFLGLTGAAYFLGFDPIFQKRVVVQAQRDALVTTGQEATTLAAALSRMRQQLKTTQTAVNDHALRLESIEHFNLRLAQVTHLANECGLEIDQIEPRDSLPATHYVKVPIRVTGNGSFAASSSFLHRLHQTLPDIAVASLAITGRPGSHQKPPGFQFHLHWYAAPIQVPNPS